MKSCDKHIILIFIGNYLPGYKAGGILRGIVNTVDHLSHEFEFRIITRDRDLGDEEPYPDIKINQWQKVGNAMVYYLSPRSSSTRDILALIKKTPHQVIYLNSFLDPFTIKVLANRKLHKSFFKGVVVAPWGEFGWASLKQKFLKKYIFIQFARVVGLYDNVFWRASSEFEKSDILKYMKVKSDSVHIADDFPVKGNVNFIPDPKDHTVSDNQGCLKIVFLSRISREKNLDYALKVLKRVKVPVVFDIYGPAENSGYWRECQELIAQLPDTVTTNYRGAVNADQVVNVFSRYDLFLFPTGGEAYGHVIAESLTSGTPVLISTETPWRDLMADELGWDIDLSQIDSFVDRIEELSSTSKAERARNRAIVRTKVMKRLFNPMVLETNRQLFIKALAQ